MFLKSLSIAIIAGIISVAEAQCEAVYHTSLTMWETTYTVGSVVSDAAVCLSQGEGDWTFSMVTMLATNGWTGEGGAAFQAGTAFIVFDNYCSVRGIYARPSCAVPWAINNADLPYGISVTVVNTSVGEGATYFKMLYGDGSYAIKDNGNVCSKMEAGGLTAVKGCRAGFPQSGVQPAKRSARFVQF